MYKLPYNLLTYEEITEMHHTHTHAHTLHVHKIYMHANKQEETKFALLAFVYFISCIFSTQVPHEY